MVEVPSSFKKKICKAEIHAVGVLEESCVRTLDENVSSLFLGEVFGAVNPDSWIVTIEIEGKPVQYKIEKV